MGYPMSFFHFFLTRCVGWNKVLLISSKKFGFFYFFLNFFNYFCPFFRKKHFLAYLPPFSAPLVIFSFFSDRMCWVEYSFTHFKREIGNFFIFKNFFSLFLPIFQKNHLLAHLPPFNAPHVIISFFSDRMCWVE